jgi:hypothetical protein
MMVAHPAVEGAHLLAGDPAVLVGIGPCEHLRGARARLGERDRAVIVGVEMLHRTVHPASPGMEGRACRRQRDGGRGGGEADLQFPRHLSISCFAPLPASCPI